MRRKIEKQVEKQMVLADTALGSSELAEIGDINMVTFDISYHVEANISHSCKNLDMLSFERIVTDYFLVSILRLYQS